MRNTLRLAQSDNSQASLHSVSAAPRRLATDKVLATNENLAAAEPLTDHWSHHAACRAHPEPDLWYPDTPAQARQAKLICATCPVQRQCGHDAVDQNEQHAIAGGYDCSVDSEWRQLHAWLGLAKPAIGRSKSELRTLRCSCGREFQTRRANAKRCHACVQGHVPAEPVWKYITDLLRLLTSDQIGELAGISGATVRSIRRQEFVKKETAAKICSITLVGAAGTVRGACHRVPALLAPQQNSSARQCDHLLSA
ncbi:WhiB family transcriptional regulator [Nocardia transvalensis]|uniref:WhiB family transcriptional regulator n=1 Tax=Nocardia transvalensis TaxID=37333 RepID=UPI001894C673|nr:WhiB family transcriptional regulator [Nocardia transvalensis]MBF6333669.1 WhiB family transcriptional regulator [Nocardia transvalensis]